MTDAGAVTAMPVSELGISARVGAGEYSDEFEHRPDFFRRVRDYPLLDECGKSRMQLAAPKVHIRVTPSLAINRTMYGSRSGTGVAM